jgi:HEAT repeat protein
MLIEALILQLESSNSSVRDKAALELMDRRDERAVEPLLRAIAQPENINHRGTLVYALSAFNCDAFLELLVDLVVTGNFEVSCGAFGIIEGAEADPDSIQRIESRLLSFDPDGLSNAHQVEAFEALRELVQEAKR